MTTETFVKDIKPGLKNLNLIFIVLETGGYSGMVGPLRGGSQGWGGGRRGRASPPLLTSYRDVRVHPKTLLTRNLLHPGLESCSRVQSRWNSPDPSLQRHSGLFPLSALSMVLSLHSPSPTHI